MKKLKIEMHVVWTLLVLIKKFRQIYNWFYVYRKPNHRLESTGTPLKTVTNAPLAEI